MPAHDHDHLDPGGDPDPRVLWRWVGDALRPWVGWIFVGLGGLLMLLGWFGVSREALPAKQIPYLVSGGIGGVFLAVVGAFFLGTQELRKDSGRLDRLERMVEELHLALLRRPDAPELPPRGDGAPTASSNGHRSPARRVVTVPGGELFHRGACPMVAGKEGTEITPGVARKQGLRPCPACDPAPAPRPAPAS